MSNRLDDEALQKSEGRSPKNKLRARCPACNAWVNLRDAAEVWDLVNCPECDTLLEIMELRPPTLDYANTELDDEEWDEEEWDEDYPSRH
jgi:lysine biosynthesis protein LysW